MGIHATSYIVELFEYGTNEVQRFVRTVPENLAVPLIDFRVSGLRPSAYASCVRCVAPCGCQSAPSRWSYLPPSGMSPPASLPAAACQISPPLHVPQAVQQIPETMLGQVSHPPPPNLPVLSTAPITTLSALAAVPEETADDAEDGSCDALVLD